MVRGHATAYIGSPRLAEMVTGERVTLEEMGGALMHCSESGLGDVLVDDDAEAIAAVRLWLSYLPSSWRGGAPRPHPPRAAPPPPPPEGNRPPPGGVPLLITHALHATLGDAALLSHQRP